VVANRWMVIIKRAIDCAATSRHHTASIGAADKRHARRDYSQAGADAGRV